MREGNGEKGKRRGRKKGEGLLREELGGRGLGRRQRRGRNKTDSKDVSLGNERLPIPSENGVSSQESLNLGKVLLDLKVP